MSTQGQKKTGLNFVSEKGRPEDRVRQPGLSAERHMAELTVGFISSWAVVGTGTRSGTWRPICDLVTLEELRSNALSARAAYCCALLGTAIQAIQYDAPTGVPESV